MINFSVGVILPSAGFSERFGVPVPKQYYEVLVRVISHSVSTAKMQFSSNMA